MDQIDKIKELVKLYENGHITLEEYEKLKHELISGKSENFDKKTELSEPVEIDSIIQTAVNEDDEKATEENEFGIITLNKKEFISFKELLANFEKEKKEIIESTAHCQVDSLIVPSIYLIESSELGFKGSLAIPHLFFSLWSFNNSVGLCLEEVRNPFINHFKPRKNKYNMFLTLERASILEFDFDRNVEFMAVKPKKSYQLFKNMQGGVAGGYLGFLLVKGGAELGAKIEKDTFKNKGDLFSLKYKNGEKIEELKIACERNNTPAFLIFLRNHWCTDEPIFKEEPYTSEEFQKVKTELLMIGDRVRFPRFFNYGEGIIVEKGETEAIIKTNKNGVEKEESIRYSKLTRIE